MDNEQKKGSGKKEPQPPYTFSDDATQNKIKRHINDIKDVITEDDIANAKIPGEEAPVVQPGKEKEEKKDTNPVNPGEGKPVTPWDIIDWLPAWKLIRPLPVRFYFFNLSYDKQNSPIP